MGVTKFPNGVGTSDTNYLGNDGSLTLDGTSITAAEIAALGGTGLSAAELGTLDGAVAGTQADSKVVLPDANVNIGVTKVTELHVGATGAEVQVLATQGAAEADYTITWTANEPTAGDASTIADGDTPTVGETGQAIADLTAKLNTVLAALRANGIIAT